jgi:hypothetical protein
MISKIRKKYLVIISTILLITIITFVFILIPSEPKRKSYEPPPPLLEPNTALGVKIKKLFEEVNLEISAGVMKPHKDIDFSTNILEYLMKDKGYKLKLKNVKINLKDKDKSIELEADMALSNEELSRMTIKGIRRINQKGFEIDTDTRAIKLTIKNDGVHVEKLM